MTGDLTVRPERPEEFEKIGDLVFHSFREGTPYSDGFPEKELLREIRKSPYYLPELALVAERDGEMVGHCVFTRFPLSKTFEQGGYDRGARDAYMLLLSPVAVRVDLLRKGIGGAMLKKGLALARAAGYRGVVVEGNPAFYHTLGFVSAYNFGIKPSKMCELPSPDCLMAMPLYEGALDGVEGYVDYSMYDNA